MNVGKASRTDHAVGSGFLVEASGSAHKGTAVPDLSGGDALSDVLRSVRLSGALFFLVDATSPWCVDIPHVSAYADIIMPRAQHVISYHIMVDGHGQASVPGVDSVPFDTGDIIVFPHGDPYILESSPDVPPEFDADETIEFFRALAAGQLPFVVSEGGGQPPRAKVICGFLGCDIRPFNPLLSALPRLLHVKRPHDGGNDLLNGLVEMTMAEARKPKAGGESIRLGLSELLFVEVLRRHLASLDETGGGWFSGLRDPAVGRALSLLHERPAEPWTLASLARMAGMSRSVLADRFSDLVGHTPMRYLAQWRMQLAARMLSEGSGKVAAVGAAVGYASEAAFSRSFKKATGLTPVEWRRKPEAPHKT